MNSTAATAAAAQSEPVQFAKAAIAAQGGGGAANDGDPLAYFLQANVPLSFLLDCGKISLQHMLDEPMDEYRIVSRTAEGQIKESTFRDPLSFFEGALAAGLKPWGATEDDPPALTFYNALPFRKGRVTWFSMDDCTASDSSMVPLSLPSAELKRELANERRRDARQRQKYEREQAKTRAAALARFSAVSNPRVAGNGASAGLTH